MLLFYKISAWVFLIHMFLYAGFYYIQCEAQLKHADFAAQLPW